VIVQLVTIGYETASRGVVTREIEREREREERQSEECTSAAARESSRGGVEYTTGVIGQGPKYNNNNNNNNSSARTII